MNESAELQVAGTVLLKGQEGFGHGRRIHADVQEGPIPLIAIATAVDDLPSDGVVLVTANVLGRPLSVEKSSAVPSER